MESLRQQYDRAVLPVYRPPSPVFVRASGAIVWDTEARAYIDLGGGIAVLSLGHCFAPVSQAIAEQAATLMHVSNLHVNAPAVRLSSLLVEHTFANKVFLCNSGAEANEAAIKLARKRGVAMNPDKYHILSFHGSFHGRVGMAMAATEKLSVREGFGPLAPGFHFARFNDCAQAEAMIDESFCAIIVEPVQGESGVHVGDVDFLRTLRNVADRHQALLIYDEVQSGVGRTGALYAYMHHDVVPDILTTAKGLGNGFPVAAMLAHQRVAGILGVGDHGTTYGGNALAARVATVVLQTLLADDFLPAVQERAAIIREGLRNLQQQYNCFSEIRQSGLLIGCDMVPRISVQALIEQALAEGLIVIPAASGVLRLAPALNIPLDVLEEGLSRLGAAVGKVA